MSYIGKKNGNPNTDFLEAGGELENHDLVNVDASGNLLVGKTSTGIATAGVELRSNDDVLITKDGDTCLYMNRLTSDGTIIEIRKDGTTKGTIGVTGSNAYFNSSGGTTKLFVSGVDTYNADSTAFYPTPDNAKDLGYSSFRWNDLYLGGGVYVGGTGSANYLDDYEEGTWTPTFIDSGGGATFSLDIASGKYTKIGNQVLVQLDTRLDYGGTTGTASGNMRIGGLPFTSANTSGMPLGGISVTWYNNAYWGSAASKPSPANCVVENNTTQTGDVQEPNGDRISASDIPQNGRIRWVGQYKTDA